MKMGIYGRLSVVTALGLFVGLSPILPAKAQDGQTEVHRKIIIRTEDGVQEIELDPSQFTPSGPGDHVVIMRAGPNGEVNTIVGGPELLNMAGGPGFSYGIPGAGAPGGAYAGLDVIDPGTSYLFPLLKRIDVGWELQLTARQREALEALEKNQQDTRRQQLTQSIQAMNGKLQGMTKDEAQQTMEERARKMEEQVKGLADERQRALATILKPGQLERLKQIDLQYRGPLAMGVRDVAEQTKLTKEQAGSLADLLKEYRQEVRKTLAFGIRTVSLSKGAASSAPIPPPPSLSPNEFRSKLVKAKKDIGEIRRKLDTKALASLPDAQRAQWSALSGKPFEFHPAL